MWDENVAPQKQSCDFFFFFVPLLRWYPFIFDISQSAEFWLRASYQKREVYFLGIFLPCGNVCFVEKAAHMQMSKLTSAAELVVTAMWWATGTFNKGCYLIKKGTLIEELQIKDSVFANVTIILCDLNVECGNLLMSITNIEQQAIFQEKYQELLVPGREPG